MAAVAGLSSNTLVLKTLRSSRPAQTAGRARVVVKAASRPLWLPGTDVPAYLDGSLPGDYGFDPFRLGEEPEALKWYVQAELQNGRWAMLGSFGILFHNLLGKLGLGGPAAQVAWFDAGKYEYFAPASSLFIAELFLFAWVEMRRYQDIVKPGSTNVDPIFSSNKLPDGNVPGYPGGIFNPLGFGKDNMAEMKQKEIKNGRLAMLSIAGFIAQARTTGKTPLDNLGAHLADPWAINVFTLETAR